jgi:fumarate reductase subunit D
MTAPARRPHAASTRRPHPAPPRRRVTAEPFLWLLFSAGGMAAALILPVLLLLFGIVFPLGWLDAPDYERLHGLAQHPLTRLILLGVLALSLFHWAHRFRFTLYHGLRLHRSRIVIAVLCYGAAVLGSAAAAVLLLQL